MYCMEWKIFGFIRPKIGTTNCDAELCEEYHTCAKEISIISLERKKSRSQHAQIHNFMLSLPLWFTASKFSLNFQSSICSCVCACACFMCQYICVICVIVCFLFNVIGFDEHQFRYIVPIFWLLKNPAHSVSFSFGLTLRETLLIEQKAYYFPSRNSICRAKPMSRVTFKIQICAHKSEINCHYLLKKMKGKGNATAESSYRSQKNKTIPLIFTECHSIPCHSSFNFQYCLSQQNQLS